MLFNSSSLFTAAPCYLKFAFPFSFFNPNVMSLLLQTKLVMMYRAAHRGGQLGHFAPGPSLKGAPGGPTKGPLNTCLKDRYTLIEQSDLNTLIEQSQYSSEEQCSKLIDKEIWLVMGSYCHCQQVVTFFFFFFFFWSSPYNLGQGPHFNSLH